MAKYKDTDRLMAILENRCDEADNVEAWLAYAIACEDVRDLPVADVVEVCRCKHCSKSMEHPNGRWCKLHQSVVQNSDYCSWGRRKDWYFSEEISKVSEMEMAYGEYLND